MENIKCGCLKATIGRIGTGLSATVSVVNEPLKATIGRIGTGLSANIGLVCEPTIDMPKLPYTPLEYIESTGTQWIDTGIVPTTITDYEFIGAITETAKTTWIAGAPTWIGIHKKSATVAVTQFSNGMTYIPIETNEVFKVGVIGDKAYFNDSETNSLDKKKATKSLFLFAYHHTNDTGTMCSFIRMYSFKIWEQGVLIRDFIPVLDENDVVCMYDKVSETFFYNQGTGDFIAGKEI